jgi:histidine phosphotransferase ChpT
MNALDLSALVSARFCHDLISPLGAIGNGLELLQMTGSGSAELELISDSLANALAKLRFFRIAFGPADPESRMTFEDANETTRTMFNGRMMIAWPEEKGCLHRPAARLVFLAILCLEKSLPMGGLLRVSTAEDTIILSVEGRRVSAPDALWSHVVDGIGLADAKSDNVQFPMMRLALLDSHHEVEAEFGETKARLRLRSLAPQPA